MCIPSPTKNGNVSTRTPYYTTIKLALLEATSVSTELTVQPSEISFEMYVWSCGTIAIGGLTETESTKTEPLLSDIESASAVRYNSHSRIGKLLSLARVNLGGVTQGTGSTQGTL